MPLFDQLHPDWQEALGKHKRKIDHIERKILNRDIAPPYDLIFRPLQSSLKSTRVVIFGQDPYPGKGHAHGLAFSVDSGVSPLPPSLRNIFTELANDLSVVRNSGDLSDWRDQGVMLINRILTTDVGISKAHEDFGWQEITNRVAEVLGQRDVIAVLWGSSAIELKRFFKDENVILSVHPSPLSAYRGFFGSQPFSQVNSKLKAKGFAPVVW